MQKAILEVSKEPDFGKGKILLVLWAEWSLSHLFSRHGKEKWEGKTDFFSSFRRPAGSKVKTICFSRLGRGVITSRTWRIPKHLLKGRLPMYKM